MALFVTGDKLTQERMQDPHVNSIKIDTGITQDAWQTLTLQNGWASFGNGYPALKARKDKQGNVVICGAIAGGTATNGTTVATLPLGLIPNYTSNLPVSNITTGSTTAPASLSILATGELKVFGLTNNFGVSIFLSIPLVSP